MASVLAVPVAAQEDDLVVVIDQVLTDDYEGDGTLQVYVTVRHPQVGAVDDLGPEDFTLSISGEQPFVPDEAEFMDDAQVSLALVLELYQTMAGKPLEDAKAAIKHLCTTKPPQDRVALFSVRHDVDPDSQELDDEFEHDFTEDGGAVDNFAQGLQPVRGRGGTPLYDTMVRAMRFTAEVSEEPVGRRAVVVITDGGDVGSRYNDQTVIEVAQKLKVPIYTIGYTGQNRRYDQSLNEIANRTGGSYRNTPDTADFETFLDEVREEMSKHYLLTFQLENLESGRHIIEVRADASGLSGTDDQVFELEAAEATATPVPEDTATPAATPQPGDEAEPTVSPTDEPDGGTGTSLVDWVKDNFLLVAGAALLLIVLLVAAIVLVWRRSRQSGPAWPDASDASYYPPPPPAGAGDAGLSGETMPKMGAGPDQGVDTGARTEFAPESPPAGTPVMGEPFAQPEGFGPPPPPPSPPSQPPPEPEPDVQRSPTSGTVILDRGPKMEHYAMLIDQVTKAKYDIDQPSITIGRSGDNAIQLPSEKVSRQHAVIKLEGDDFRLYDLGSANGTFVNEQRWNAPVALQDGDLVRLGDMSFVFKLIS